MVKTIGDVLLAVIIVAGIAVMVASNRGAGLVNAFTSGFSGILGAATRPAG